MIDANNSKGTTPATIDIAQRLAELNRWQEQQKRLLEERQNQQRQRLGLEQRNMYEMLGLMQGDLTLGDVDVDELTEAEQTNVGGLLNDSQKYDDHAKDLQNDEEEFTVTEPTTVMNTHRSSGYGSELPPPPKGEVDSSKPKRKFLKRGEGLKQRFKIDPDELRITNLPRYKFANAHPEFKTPKQTRRGILKQKSKPKPDTIKPMTEEPTGQPPLDMHEKRFQHLLISSRTMCNSTPDLKSSCASSTNATTSPKVRFVELPQAIKQRPPEQHLPTEDEGSTTSTTVSTMQGVTWARVLDTQQIKPVQVRLTTAHVEDDENISIFELLEQKAQEGNIDMNSSCIRAFMARKQRQIADDSDVIPVSARFKEIHLAPQVHEIIDDDDEHESTMVNEQTDSNCDTPIQVGRAQVHVRFSDSNDTHEYTEETTSETSTLPAEDSVDNAALFQQFKTALFQALDQRKAQAEATQQKQTESDELSDLLQEKAYLVKQRLSELEAEIAMFKENNTQLLRMKQQHELEKANYAHEHGEAMERLHDEKIQFELYMHDERMKLDEERRKFEQQMRMQKSNASSKEKKEIATLKEEVQALQAQLKQKEQAHVSAQARLRAQLRTLEKDQRHCFDQIEELSKENKRLQMEAMKIGRENNNKMLQEINRNIARLAPKVTMETEQARRTKSFGGLESSACNQHKTNKPARQSLYGIVSENNDKKNKHSRSRSKTRRKQLEQCLTSSSETDEQTDDHYDENDAELLTAELKTPPKSGNKHKQSASPPKPKPATNTEAISNTVNEMANNTQNSSTQEFKREIVNPDGSKDIWYPNGNLKKISADGMTVRMLYFNKDIKETDIRAGTVKYYYSETNTWHTTYLDGLEILEFPNGQIEHRHKNGIVEIHFPNNTIKIVDPSDELKLEEWRYADGTKLVQMRNGDKVLSLPNGQKEIHTKLNKRREYPDGTVKLVYPDGSQETRYSNGRVRLKDKDGKLIMDTDMAKY